MEFAQHRWLVNRGAEKFILIEGDILADKSTIAPPVLGELGRSAHLVANLPYNIATPLVAECMLESWRAVKTHRGVRFDSLTFTVQQEVAQRFAATAGRQFGPVSVILSLLGRVSLGPVIPAGSFWPRPKIASQIVRIDFDEASAGELCDAMVLRDLLAMTFTQRRKRISSTPRSRGALFEPEAFAEALAEARVDGACRADQISPGEYKALSNILAAQRVARAWSSSKRE
jgi:16S rRNA (adenine1518-N6/adenine1519-N6)-dimethyltransferase